MDVANRTFLLSPAKAGGTRARLLLNPEAKFELAVRFRESGASIGEVFSFLSGLYFRGKIAYAARFGRGSGISGGGLVIAPGEGLVPVTTTIRPRDLEAFGKINIDINNPAYTEPLLLDAKKLSRILDPEQHVVLLGSIATPKYVVPLMQVFRKRLVYPECFAGCGDMRRGSLMLRASSSGEEFSYIQVCTVAEKAT